MPTSIRKVSAIGTKFTRSNQNNEYSIEIPQSTGFVDLKRSTKVLRLTTKEIATPGTNAFRPWSLSVAPELLFESCTESSGKAGLISQQNYLNVVHANLDPLTISRQEAQAAVNLGMDTGYYPSNTNEATGSWNNGIGTGTPRDIVPRGYSTPFWQPSVPKVLGEIATAPSVMNEAEIHIPMDKFSVLANSDAHSQFPVILVNGLTYNFKLDQKIRGTQYIPTQRWDCNNATADAAGDLTQVVLNYTFQDNNDLKKLDLAVGMLAQVEWAGGSGGAGSQQAIVTSIEATTAGLCNVSVNLNSLNANQTLTGLTINWVDPPTNPPEYEVQEAYFSIHKLLLTQQQLENAVKNGRDLVINFNDFQVKPQQVVPGTNFQQSMEVPKNARGVAVLTPQIITGPGQASRLKSGFDNVENYNFKTTNTRGILAPTTRNPVPTYNSTGRFNGSSDILDIWNNRALHNQRLRDFYRNIGIPLKRYELHGYVGTTFPNSLARQSEGEFFPQMLIPANEQHTLTLELSTDGTKTMSAKNAYFVFVRNRQLVIKDNMAMVM